jgi:hypothetical protein
MTERGDRARVALEPLAPAGIVRKPFGQHLDGHSAIEPRVPRLVHFAHAAGSKEAEQLIGTERAPVGSLIS